MLQQIPAPLFRVGLRVAHVLRTLWWRVARPQIIGCRVMALDDSGHVLMVRHSYGSGRWSMPGGGVGAREEPLAAALRELREETGCVLVEARELVVLFEDLSGAGNRVHLVAGRVSGEVRADGREVIEARFFPVDALPANTARGLPERIPQWAEQYRAYSSGS